MHKNKRRLPGGDLYEKASTAFRNLPQKAQDKITNTVGKQLIQKAGLKDENTPANLRRYCIFVLSLVSAAKFDMTGRALSKIRNNILDNLPVDIESFLKEGKTKEETVNFYWDVKEFQELWGKLGLNKEHLESMVYKR